MSQTSNEPAAPAEETVSPRTPFWLRWLRRLALTCIALFAIWSVIWFGYAQFLKQQLDDILLSRQQQGVTMRYASSTITGYPTGWYLQTTAPEMVIEETGSRLASDSITIGFDLATFRQFRWHTDGVVSARLAIPANDRALAFTHVTIDARQADGSFELGSLGLTTPRVKLDDIEISLRHDEAGDDNPAEGEAAMGEPSPDNPPSINLDQQQPDAPLPPATGSRGGLPIDRVHIDTLQTAMLSPVWPAAKPEDTALTVEAKLLGITGGDPAAAPVVTHGLSNRVKEFSFRAIFTGPLLQGTHAYALNQWREQGGALRLQDLIVDLDNVVVKGDLRGRLDAGLQPEGQGELTIAGYEAVLEALLNEGVVPQQLVRLIQLMFAPMAKPGPDGNKTVSLPLSIKDRWLSLGPIRLIRVPPIQWQGAPPPAQ